MSGIKSCAHMKTILLLSGIERDKGELIATFGDARIVKRSADNKLELVGGSQEDRRAALEWCSLFLKVSPVIGVG